MPTLTSTDFPRPRNWQDFEDLCRDLWSRIWQDPGTQGHGRPGQEQDGVDVFGRPGRGRDWAGVQCKLRKGSLSRAEVKEEIRKAEAFNPRLSDFIIATTAPRDAALQKVVRKITAEREKDGLFPVSIAAWEDICLELAAHPDLVAKHYPGFVAIAGSSAARSEYLGSLWARLLPVPYLAVVGKQREIPLSAVYTALDVTARIHVADDSIPESPQRGTWQIELPGEPEILERLRQRAWREARQAQEGRQGHEDEHASYGRLCTAVEAAASAPHLVLKGPAGSGKSTFVRYLALSLAGTALERTEANLERLNGPQPEGTLPADLPWPHGDLLPIFVELKSFVRSGAFPAEGRTGEASHLLKYFSLPAFDEDASRYEPFLREALRSGGDGCLLILDGLDETPAAEASRERLCSIIRSFARQFPRCRVLVTSRPYAYEQGDSWRLDGAGFREVSLAPFDQGKIRTYVESWYALLAERGQLGPEQAETFGADLVGEIERTSYLQPLAERPLMLSMMADVHAAGGGRFRGGRAELYEASVELLLDRWNERRGVLDGESVTELLGMDVDGLRKALEKLAFEVHRDRGAGAGSEEAGRPAEIPDTELWKTLDRARPRESVVDERRVMDYLHQRSGILVAESPSLFRFPHRSYQEYLAACYLVRAEFPRLFRETVAGDPALWREVALLAAGRESRTPLMIWSVLEALVPDDPPGDISTYDPRFLRALFAGLAIEENGLWEVESQYEERCERVRRWLERTLVDGALAPIDRAAAGRVLGRLGDRRFGVGLDADGVPEIDWVDVPAGSFVMGTAGEDSKYSGTPQVEVELPAYRISRYPVTNAQYRAFVADGGYTDAWKHCWTGAGWEWKGDRTGPREIDASWLVDNLPRVVVTWYEAFAFCGWLAEKLGHAVRLPSEAEWEKAARGEDGRAYPWGEIFDAARCNAGETAIRWTSAVGMFPSGASPFDVLDMSGNVDEWCATRWRERYDQEMEDDPEGEARRVVRGGSFGRDRRLVRCASRGDLDPDFFFFTVGFRVCAPIL